MMLDEPLSRELLTASVATHSDVQIRERFTNEPIGRPRRFGISPKDRAPERIIHVGLLPDDAAFGKWNRCEFRRFEHRELAEHTVVEQELVPVVGVPKPVRDRPDRLEPVEPFDEPVLPAFLHDREEVQIREFVESLALETSRSKADQGKSVSGSLESSPDIAKPGEKDVFGVRYQTSQRLSGGRIMGAASQEP